jgi:inner membrane protein
MKKTHLFTGIALTIPFISLSNIILLPAVIGSVAPDWDYRIGIKHRTITHSLIALIISSAFLGTFNIKLGLLWALNYTVHLLLDSLTKMGVPLLYPWRKKYYGKKLFRTHGAEDGLLALISIYIISSLI